jgi:hypothetical protein
MGHDQSVSSALQGEQLGGMRSKVVRQVWRGVCSPDPAPLPRFAGLLWWLFRVVLSPYWLLVGFPRWFGFCITPILYCRLMFLGGCQGGKDALTTTQEH